MGKKSCGPRASLAENFIQFQIEVKRKEIEEFMDEIKQLEAKNQKLLDMRDQLREKRFGHIRMLHRQVQSEKKKLELKAAVDREQIKEALKHNQELTQTQDKELTDLRRQLADVQTQVVQLQAQRETQTDNAVHELQIRDLKSELGTMEKDFHDLTEHFKQSMEVAWDKVEEKTSQLIDEQKQLAIERAMKLIDRPTYQALTEIEWLKRKLSIYREEVSTLDAAISSLEEENLDHLRRRLENQISDLQISRDVFLTQTPGLVETLSITSTADLGVEETAEAERDTQQQAEVSERDEMDGSCGPSSLSVHDLSSLLYASPSEIGEPMLMGPLAQKLMIVVGRAVTLYPAPTDSRDLGTPRFGFLQKPNQPTPPENRIH